MNKKRLSLGAFLAGAIALVPMVVSSCGISGINHKNFLVNYDNALDNALSLGIAPDYFLSNTYRLGEKLRYAPYMEEYLNKDLTEVVDINIYDGKETDLKAMARLEPYAFLVNEWEKVDADQYKDVVEHMLYTSMGDTIDARWNSTDTTKDEGMTRFYQGISGGAAGDRYAKNDYGVSPQKALEMAAKDIDNAYNTNDLFSKRAKIINDLTEQRIKTWNNSSEFKKLLTVSGVTSSESTNQETNINVGIISGGSTNSNTSFKFLTPNALPMFYSTLSGRGLGFNFPEPKNANFKNSTNYVETFITAADSKNLLDQFAGKFDYLIYYSSLSAESSNQPAVNPEDFKSLLKTEKQSNASQYFYSSTYHDIYDPIWGVMGLNHLLDILQEKIIPQFAKNLNNFSLATFNNEVNTVKINFPKANEQTNIRVDTDFSTFREHNYTV